MNTPRNEIILNPNGSTYIGELSQKFATNRLKLPTVFRLDDAQFHVFEVTPDSRVIHRASQSSRLLAEQYMETNRVCVYSGDAMRLR